MLKLPKQITAANLNLIILLSGYTQIFNDVSINVNVKIRLSVLKIKKKIRQYKK